jgi:hypothetical protein
MSSLIKQLFFILLCGLLLNNLYADESPPPGFESVSSTQTNYVDAYFMGNYLVPLLVTIDDNTIEIDNPHALILDLPQTIDTTKILNALSGKISNNTSQACSYALAKKPCNILSPKVASVIYDQKKMRLYVFINPRFLPHVTAAQAAYLPTPNANISYMNTLTTIDSFSNNILNYALQSHSALARKNFDLTLDANYDGNRDFNSDTIHRNVNNFQMDNFVGSYAFAGKYLQAGMVSTQGASIISTQDLLGVSFKTDLNQLQSQRNIRGIPIEIYLSTQSLISVYKNGRLISSASYSAGNQILDTTNFPEGAYDVNIKITDANNNVRTVTRFYVKSTSIPPLNHPQFSMSLGQLEQTTTNTPTIPTYGTASIYQLGYAQRLTDNWAMGENLLGSKDLSVSETDISWLLPYITLTGSLLYGTDGDWGTGANSQTVWGNSSLGFQFSKIYGHIYTKTQTNQNNVFDPITSNKLQASLYFSQRFKYGSANTSFSEIKTADNAQTNAFNIAYQLPFTWLKKLRSRLQLGYQVDETDRLVSLTLSFAIVQDNVTHSLSTNIQHYLHGLANDRYKNDYNVAYNLDWNKHQLGMTKQRANLKLTHDESYNSALASYSFTNNLAYVNTSINRNQPTLTANNTQFSLTASTGIVLKPGQASLSNTRLGTTGFLVKVQSPNSKDKFEVLINGKPINVIRSNKATFIYAPAFKTYSVSIESLNKTLYSFDSRLRNVTLFTNNVQYLSWHAMTKYVLITQLVYPDHKPLGFAQIKGGHAINQTDSTGYLHAEVTDADKHLLVDPLHGPACKLDLTKVKPKEGFYYQKKMVCKPTGEYSSRQEVIVNQTDLSHKIVKLKANRPITVPSPITTFKTNNNDENNASTLPKNFLYVTRLYYPNHRALGSAKIVDGNRHYQTDSIGYVHAELNHTTGVLLVQPVRGPKCEVLLKHIIPVRGIYYATVTYCQPLIDKMIFFNKKKKGQRS